MVRDLAALLASFFLINLFISSMPSWKNFLFITFPMANLDVFSGVTGHTDELLTVAISDVAS